MNSKSDNWDNSLDAALNMSQDEIESLLNGQLEEQNHSFDLESTDLESLLSELEEADDADIQEIADLLDKADNNEAAGAEIEELILKQEKNEGVAAYDVADLFSGEDIPGKKGFFQRIVEKFRKKTKEEAANKNTEAVEQADDILEAKPQEEDAGILELNGTEEKQPKKKKNKKKEKKIKDKKKGDNRKKEAATEEVSKQEWDTIDVFQASEEALNESDAIILELGKAEASGQEKADLKEVEKDKKGKKDKKKKEKKDKQEKKPKEKKSKEKKVKIKEADILEPEEKESVSGKKVRLIFFVCIMLMFAIIAIIVAYSGHANRELAEEAYLQEDYLQCYQLLYGQHMNESQEVMFHKSELILKMELFWNRYEAYVDEDKLLEGLDKLIQFVYDYPELEEYAAGWNCEGVVSETYEEVLNTLWQEYWLDEEEALEIAGLESDVDYTRTLTELTEKKKQGKLKYPDMLPEEEEWVEQENQQKTGGQDDSDN